MGRSATGIIPRVSNTWTPEGGVSRQKLEEMRIALREPGFLEKALEEES
jgi:hypothetical protein